MQQPQPGNERKVIPTDAEIGFIGLGVMGQPIALNLAAAGARLVVWNRSVDRSEPLRQAGAVGLAEAVHFASRNGLDLSRFRDAISAGPMACDVTRVKIRKFMERDFGVQAATADALHSCRLIAAAARDAGIVTPVLDLSTELYADSVKAGNERLDMISVIRSIEARSGQ